MPAPPRQLLGGVHVKKRADAEGSLAEAAQAALEAVQQGRTEQAALVLYRRLGNFIVRRLAQGDGDSVAPMNESDAEENLFPTIERFVNSKPDGRAGGMNWLYRAMNSQALDFNRRQQAQKRGGGLAFVPLEGDDGEILDEVQAAAPLYGHNSDTLSLEDCMDRAATEFEADHPTYGRLLRLIMQGLEGDDLVAEFAADPARITEKDRNNFKSRKSTMMSKARGYFGLCKE